MIRIFQSLCALLLFACAASAQDAPVRIDPGISQAGAAYERAILWRGIQSDVQYFDPDGPAPSANLRLRERQLRPDPQAPDTVSDGDRGIATAFVVLIIAGVAFMVYRFGNFSALGFGAGDAARSPSKAEERDSESEDPATGNLAQILSMRDRAEAVHALLAAALRRAAAQLDLYLHPSWTARDILRRIPADWAGRGALGDLARVAEEVHFGGRTISEDEFDRVARAIAPLFRGEPA